MHGGFVGGAKDEFAGYFKLIASNGYVVVGHRYLLAPEHRYPTAARSVVVRIVPRDWISLVPVKSWR